MLSPYILASLTASLCLGHSFSSRLDGRSFHVGGYCYGVTQRT